MSKAHGVIRMRALESLSTAMKKVGTSSEDDLYWISTSRVQIKALTSELMCGIKSIHLLFLSQTFESKMRRNLAKGNLSKVNFKEWNTAIRNVLYHLRMLINLADLQINKKRIHASLGRLSATYLNFVLKSQEGAETITPETCNCVAVGVYQFLKLMTTQGDGSSSPLQLMDSILSSEELLHTSSHKGIAYYLITAALADRNFYADKPEAFLKFLALASVFRMNFTHSKKAVQDCLDDSKYRGPPASSMTGSKYLSFLKAIETDQEEEELELPCPTSESIFKRIILSKLIRSSKLACKFKEVPKIKMRKVKKYLSKIVRKGRGSMHIRGKGNLSSESQLSSAKKQCNGLLSETIDEIMTKGHERAEDSSSTDMNEENESNSGRSSSASNRTEELNPAVEVHEKSNPNGEESSRTQAESEPGSELDDIILTDEEQTSENSAAPPLSINNEATATVIFSTDEGEVESLGDASNESVQDISTMETESESDSECVELDGNHDKETMDVVVILYESEDKEKIELDEKQNTKRDMQIDDDDDVEADEGQEEEDGKLQAEDEELLQKEVRELFEGIEGVEQEEVLNTSLPASGCPKETGKDEDTDFETVELDSSDDEIQQKSQSHLSVEANKAETSSSEKTDESTEEVEESELSSPQSDVRLSPKLIPRDTTPTSSGTEDDTVPSKTTVVSSEDDKRIFRSKLLLTPIKESRELNVDEGEGEVSATKSPYFTRIRIQTKKPETTPRRSIRSPVQAQKKPRGKGLETPKSKSSPRQKRISSSVPLGLDTPAKRTRSAMKKLEEEIEVVTLEEDEPGKQSSARQSRSRLSLQAESVTKSRR